MAKKNNNNKRNKISVWAAVGLIVIIWIAVLGWIFTSQERLDAKINNYQAQVQGYKNELNDINIKLGEIGEAIAWIKDAIK